MIIPDPKSVVVAPVQHQTRKVARSRMQSTSKGQLEPYRTTEINYEEFVRAFERKNDTLYFISFKRVNNHAGNQNTTISSTLFLGSISPSSSLTEPNATSENVTDSPSISGKS